LKHLDAIYESLPWDAEKDIGKQMSIAESIQEEVNRKVLLIAGGHCAIKENEKETTNIINEFISVEYPSKRNIYPNLQLRHALSLTDKLL